MTKFDVERFECSCALEFDPHHADCNVLPGMPPGLYVPQVYRQAYTRPRYAGLIV